MPNKKPPAPPTSPAKTSTRPTLPGNTSSTTPNPRLQTAKRWQRSKRYGWDSR